MAPYVNRFHGESGAELNRRVPDPGGANTYEADEPGPGNPRGGPYQDGRPSEHAFQPKWGNPNMCGYPGCTSPRQAHDDEDADEEEQRGPNGPKMPRGNDLPNYTVWGQILKKFGR
jgi:hypothetical protein